ncbi:siderophore-interacting protein [Micromonospora sp. CA-263727]|uniref:siderophore-interacting protein n=1 Tax=Micromonospora sp. CA-263727 TaxID=3239967 RepID=UPI003D8A0F7E
MTDTLTLPGFWTATVHEVQRLTPHLQRVVLGGPDLAGFPSLGAPDESVTLYFPRTDELTPPPMTVRDGVWGYHDEQSPPTGRNYSIRTVDPDEARLTIDFALHDHGPATSWARQAETGAGLLLWRRRAWFRPPADTRWLVLAADLAGLPAATRIVAERTPGVGVRVLVDLPDLADARDLLAAAGGDPAVEIDVRIGVGNGNGPGSLVERLRDRPLPAGPGYVWVAGEAGECRQARSVLRDIHHLPRDRAVCVGYWRAEAADWERRYTRHRPLLDKIYQDGLAAGLSPAEAGDRMEEELERMTRR